MVPNDLENDKFIPTGQRKILGVRNRRGKDAGAESHETDAQAHIRLPCLSPLPESTRLPGTRDLGCSGSQLSPEQLTSLCSPRDVSRTAPGASSSGKSDQECEAQAQKVDTD